MEAVLEFGHQLFSQWDLKKATRPRIPRIYTYAPADIYLRACDICLRACRYVPEESRGDPWRRQGSKRETLQQKEDSRIGHLGEKGDFDLFYSVLVKWAALA